MAFKPRNKGVETPSNNSNNIQQKQQYNQPKRINSIEVITDLKAQNSDKKQADFYKQEAIQAINEIEAKYGFDFYSDEREGGMHIGGKNRPLNYTVIEKEKLETIVNSNKSVNILLDKIKKRKNKE